MKPNRILYAGTNVTPWSNSIRRLEWLRRLGHDVGYVSLALPYHRRLDFRRALAFARMKGRAFDRVNRSFLETFRTFRPDLVWVDKGYTLFPETLERARAFGVAMFVSHLNDTPFTRRRVEQRMWIRFRECIPLFDLHLVTQELQVRQFFDAGAKRVLRVMHGVDPRVHKPQPPYLARPATAGAVVFVGNFEPDRLPIIEALVRAFGSRVKVFGPGWPARLPKLLMKAGTIERAIWDGREYAATLGAAAACVGLVSNSNGDRVTRRSYEIPACGGCFVGIRTPDHNLLFRPGVDALVWSDVDELIGHIQDLLARPERVAAIKEAAVHRARDLGFGYDQRLPRWLEFAWGDKLSGDELLESTASERH